MKYIDKLQKTIQITNDIKHKRIILDESRDNFGSSTELKNLKKIKYTVKGFPMVYTCKSLTCALKVMPVETTSLNEMNPSYIEYIFLKELFKNLVVPNITPHIVNYYGVKMVPNNSKAIQHLCIKKLESEYSIKKKTIVLISEYVDAESLYEWIDTKSNNRELQWKNIVFQIIYTLHILQDKYELMHNDFHYGNILVDTTKYSEKYFKYTTNGQNFYVKNTNSLPKLWDFEFSQNFKHINKKIFKNVLAKDRDNIPDEFNKSYDLHFFLTSLLKLDIPTELYNWIMSLYPPQVISDDTDVETDTESETEEDTEEEDTEEDTEEDAESEVESGEEAEEDTEEDTETCSTESSSYTRGYEEEFLLDKRLKNEAYTVFDLPTPESLLSDSFFDYLRTEPKDFTELNSQSFKYEDRKKIKNIM